MSENAQIPENDLLKVGVNGGNENGVNEVGVNGANENSFLCVYTEIPKTKRLF